LEKEFSQDFYDNIESFLDENQLFIISPSPLLKKTKLNCFVSLQSKIEIFPMGESNREELEAQTPSNLVIPSFLAKRKKIFLN